MSANFDFLIVGAGSAGCVLADRLSESGKHSVCLLEAGGTNNHPFIKVPAGWAATFRNSKFDWGYETEPEPELEGRRVYWPRGLGLGGSSAINGMVYIRGHALDFEKWAQEGAAGWTYEDVLPYFRKAERQETYLDEFHGREGPLCVQDVKDKRDIHNAFVNAAAETGLPINPDFNGAEQAGVGFYQFNQRNGTRWSAADAYLNRAAHRKNLTVETRAVAQRIIFEGKRASGVRILQRGRERTIDARQTILCGGAINSPQLLELSGVGNAERLKPLNIPVVHHLPDVGENLQDHMLTKVVYGTHASSSINREVQGWRLALSALNWFVRRQGPLSTGSAPCGGFGYTSEGIEAPDIQFFFASGATLYNADGRIQALPRPAITGAVDQSRPESRGSVHIRSQRLADKPEIRANYLSTELDRTTMVRGLRMVAKIFERNSLQSYVTSRISPVSELDIDDNDALLDYIRRDAGTGYHPTSTCAMGKVVDPQLAVYGVESLYVADASVMPSVVSGNTNAATIMIGEKAADLLLARV